MGLQKTNSVEETKDEFFLKAKGFKPFLLENFEAHK